MPGSLCTPEESRMTETLSEAERHDTKFMSKIGRSKLPGMSITHSYDSYESDYVKYIPKVYQSDWTPFNKTKLR